MKLIKIFLLGCLTLFSITACASKNQYNSLKIESLKSLKKVKDKNKKSFAIAFGGGGVRGFYHLGVIKALEEEGIKADIVTGTSAGSIAASLYATGMSYKQIEQKVLSLKENDITDFTLFGRGGVIQGKKLASWMQKTTKNMKIEDSSIKLGIAVSDLTNQEALLITKGDIGESVQTSSSIPGAFIPVKSNGKLLVDGGVLSLVPVEFAKALGADTVLAVDIYCGKIRFPEDVLFNIMYVANRIQSCKIAEYEMKKADFIISSEYEPKNYGNFDSKEESIKRGYEATKQIVEKLKLSI